MENNAIFKDSLHLERFRTLLELDGTQAWDRERRSLFFIISGCTDLYSRHTRIYSFSRHMLNGGGRDLEGEVCSSASALLALGLNLYNGRLGQTSVPSNTFRNLDAGNRRLAINALSMRYL